MEPVVKQIEGFPDYLVDICGRVWSKKRKELRLLKSSFARGYEMISFYSNKKLKTFKVHRLVAKAFILNPNNYRCVCHKDNNPLNNKKDNLYWGTHSMNLQQSYNDRRRKGQVGKKNTQAKLNEKQVKLIRTMYKDFGWKIRKIWRILGQIWGVSESTIDHVAKRYTWKHI